MNRYRIRKIEEYIIDARSEEEAEDMVATDPGLCPENTEVETLEQLT